MKVLLVAVNASYSHTCLAVRSIYNYVKKNVPDAKIEFKEFTINQPVGEILRGIELNSPDYVLFSTYIWNAEIVTKLIPDVKTLLPECTIGAGGPEFGYAPDIYFNKLPELDFIMFGEGEETVAQLFKQPFSKVNGIYGRDFFTGVRPLLCDLSLLPFPYPELEKLSDVQSSGCQESALLNSDIYHKIYYYESSRGCPYSCSYCMSSLDKRVRFMPLERVYTDLQVFLDAKVPLVKFVDRTYNLQPERYISIWKYILQHHNGITMFHFEIEAEYLSEEALEFLQSVPSGVMQFEIGVQSANKKALAAVNRSDNIEKLAQNVRRIPRTIHQHLDLIAGLPYEDLDSFGHSFDFVMSLKPDALQLGFLKVLHGTQMEDFAIKNGWKWMKNPVYETFSTPYMPYENMLFLKDVEVLTDAYWNSGKFVHTMNYIGRTFGWWNFFFELAKWAQKLEVFSAQRRETYWFELLSRYYQGNQLITDLLRYDFVLRGKQGGWPKWYTHIYDKTCHRRLLEQNGGGVNAREDYAYSEYEVFTYDVDSEFPEKTAGRFEKLIRYPMPKGHLDKGC